MHYRFRHIYDPELCIFKHMLQRLSLEPLLVNRWPEQRLLVPARMLSCPHNIDRLEHLPARQYCRATPLQCANNLRSFGKSIIEMQDLAVGKCVAERIIGKG